MDARWNLQSKLLSTSDWVRAEYTALAQAADEAGCAVVAESGPGASHRLSGRPVIRLHPKMNHLAVGFANSMREDVDALTEALRGQQGEAWLNYRVDVCDRETVLLLMAKAMSPREAESSPNRVSPSATAPRSARRESRNDDADLQLVLDVLRASPDVRLRSARLDANRSCDGRQAGAACRISPGR